MAKYQSVLPELNFIPNRGNFARGIFCSVYTDIKDTNNDIDYKQLYSDYYKNESFTFVVDFDVNLKNVVNTNKCFVNVRKIDGKLLISAVIDNLLKGASGQAVQNMNLMFGLNEMVGLQLKANVY